MTPETPFPALPVRQRGTLEIIDTAMKLYRRYFGVLMGWSALVSALYLVAFSVPFGAFLIYPLIAGSCCCCIAAAVRGQRVAFGQVWEFTKPRYGALLLILLLSSLLMGVAFGAIFLVSMLITLAGTWALSAMNAPTEVGIIVGGLGFILALGVGSVLSVMAYAWVGLVPIIACLEDDKRSAAALGRAWELMKGSWGRVLGLSTLLTIAVAAVMGIVIGSISLFGAGFDAFSSNAPESAILGMMVSFAGFFGLFFLFWNPIQTLILAVLYLDLRVRKEALDLEWNSYSTAPPIENSAVPAAPPTANQLSARLAQEPLTGESPASLAPAVNLPTPAASPAPAASAPVRPPAPPVRPPAPAVEAENVAPPVVFSKPPTPQPVSETAPQPAPDAFDFSTSFNAGASAVQSDANEENGAS